LWEKGQAEAAIQLEELWNGLARTHSFTLRCAYPMQHFDREEHGESFLKICAAHEGVIPGEDYTSLLREDDRSRVIAKLQQKAHALCTEIAERRLVEEELRRTKADLESLVEQRTVALRQLSARLLELQDSERRRIARELHDCLGQYLVGLKLNVDMLRRSPEREQLWTESEELMQQCISEVRTLSYLLHPPTMDAAGLASAAEWFVEGFSQRTGIKVTLIASKSIARLPDMVELTLFRSLQEALTNVHRHSGASTADIRILRSDGQVILEVKDNGCGIQQNLLTRFRQTGNGMGVGLTGMCERVRDLGGSLQIDSDLRGTAVRITLSVAIAENAST
jgi:signal transduction histidine kinase